MRQREVDTDPQVNQKEVHIFISPECILTIRDGFENQFVNLRHTHTHMRPTHTRPRTHCREAVLWKGSGFKGLDSVDFAVNLQSLCALPAAYLIIRRRPPITVENQSDYSSHPTPPSILLHLSGTVLSTCGELFIGSS